jgi:uncharacterized protein
MEKLINVRVTPRAKIVQIIEDLEGNLKVKLKAPPIEGRANAELIELLADYYKVSRRQIEIVKGLTSRQKVIKIL